MKEVHLCQQKMNLDSQFSGSSFWLEFCKFVFHTVALIIYITDLWEWDIKKYLFAIKIQKLIQKYSTLYICLICKNYCIFQRLKNHITFSVPILRWSVVLKKSCCVYSLFEDISCTSRTGNSWSNFYVVIILWRIEQNSLKWYLKSTKKKTETKVSVVFPFAWMRQVMFLPRQEPQLQQYMILNNHNLLATGMKVQIKKKFTRTETNNNCTHLSRRVVSSARTTCHRCRKSSTIIWTFVLSGGCDRPTTSRHAIPMLLIVL